MGAGLYASPWPFTSIAGGTSEVTRNQIAERIQLLGGISLAMAADIAETTQIERPPRGREEVPVQILYGKLP